jgi:hypothetical protein
MEKKKEMLALRGLWFTNLAVDFDGASDNSFSFRSQEAVASSTATTTTTASGLGFEDALAAASG